MKVLLSGVDQPRSGVFYREILPLKGVAFGGSLFPYPATVSRCCLNCPCCCA